VNGRAGDWVFGAIHLLGPGRCYSERSEESLQLFFMSLNAPRTAGILRFAQNDKRLKSGMLYLRFGVLPDSPVQSISRYIFGNLLSR